MASSQALAKDVKKFNSLPRKKMAPSGIVPNVWHFDLRFVQLEPTPAHVLHIVQPESQFIHVESVPADVTPGGPQAYAFFPETPEQAAPAIAKALIRAFSTGMGGPLVMAPWKLTTEDRGLAREVGKEFSRLGVIAALHDVGISSAAVCKIAYDTFAGFFNGLLRGISLPPIAVAAIQRPESITFNYKVRTRPSEVRAEDADDEYCVLLAYVNVLDGCQPYTKEKKAMGNANYTASIVMPALEMAEQVSTADVERAALSGTDPQAIVDLGARTYFGIQCPPNRQKARELFVKAAFHPSANDYLRTTAHALLMHWCIDASEQLRSRYVYSGIHHANEAAKASRSVSAPGHSVPGVLWNSTRLFRPAADKFPELHLFYNEVWKVTEEANARFEKESKPNVKRMKNPLRYKCARDGCGIEADRGAMFQKCGGKCDEDKKPYYCSKPCQKEDWKNHKPFCKPGMECSVIEPEITGIGARGSASKDGAISVTLPRPDGGKMILSSSTLGPEILRQVREHAEDHFLKDD